MPSFRVNHKIRRLSTKEETPNLKYGYISCRDIHYHVAAIGALGFSNYTPGQFDTCGKGNYSDPPGYYTRAHMDYQEAGENKDII